MKKIFFSFVLLFLSFTTIAATVQGDFEVDWRRGDPSEYDTGPAKDSEWVRLFGSIPKYRALGQAILGGTDEKFRWQMGPMWYRGRLGENQVKAFIVGQEGAQDENVSNRAFTGSTGTKTQKFLNHLGLYRSYLFLNTFVYTINGQRDPENPRYYWMEQNLDSPIVKYRHSLFDQMLTSNSESISLMMGVGAGGKESLVTWINARGGKCSASQNLKNCSVNGMYAWFKKNRGVEIKNKILVIGVPHPGGASQANGGQAALDNIINGFTNAAKRVAEFKEANSTWLPVDEDEVASEEEYFARLKGKYSYRDAPIPFRDFAFGTNWRMGSEGTTSNRWGADSIQVFSQDGEYAFKDSSAYGPKPSDQEELLDILQSKNNTKQILGMEPYDVPYEPPKWYDSKPDHAKQYDYGPCGEGQSPCALSQALQNWPNLYNSKISPLSAADFGTGPIYRGRLKDAQILVLADQTSHDDFFSTRALTGEVGQKLQTWLKVTGVGSSYAILRTLPVDTLDMDEADVERIALRTDVVSARQRILEEVLKYKKTKLIVTLGPVAAQLPHQQGLNDFEILGLSSDQTTAEWNALAKKAADVLGTSVVGKYNGRLTAIPREDLPVHTRWWMGTAGNRALRGENPDTLGIYYRVYAPNWATRSQYAQPLTTQEKSALKKLLQDVESASTFESEVEN